MQKGGLGAMSQEQHALCRCDLRAMLTCSLVRPIVNGVSAARWSGPASVWSAPAASPAAPLSIEMNSACARGDRPCSVLGSQRIGATRVQSADFPSDPQCNCVCCVSAPSPARSRSQPRAKSAALRPRSPLRQRPQALQ